MRESITLNELNKIIDELDSNMITSSNITDTFLRGYRAGFCEGIEKVYKEVLRKTSEPIYPYALIQEILDKFDTTLYDIAEGTHIPKSKIAGIYCGFVEPTSDEECEITDFYNSLYARKETDD